MTIRVTRSILLLMVMMVLLSAVTGCARSSSPGRPGPVSSPTAVTPPRRVSSQTAQTDPAVWTAVRFELAHCTWSWQMTLAMYVDAQQAYAGPRYGRQIAAAANATSWHQEVVHERQVVTCTVSAPARVLTAPSTSEQVYVRMTATSHVTSTLGSFDAGSQAAAWVVTLIGGRWLVTGPFEGG